MASPYPNPALVEEPPTTVAPETLTAAPALVPSPELPQLSVQGPSMIQELIPRMLQMGSLFMSPERGQAFRQTYAQQQEEQRKRRAAEQSNQLSNFIAQAMASGNMELMQSAVKQIAGLKGLEPEAYQNLQQLQVKMGQQILTDQEEEKMAAALKAADPQSSEIVNTLVKNSGMKPSAAIALIKSGLVGEPSKTMTVEGNIVRLPGTGLYARPGEQATVMNPPGMVSKEHAPTFERDLEAEVARRGLTGEAAFTFKQKARAEAQGARSFAQGFQGEMGRTAAADELPIGENSTKWINPDTGERPPVDMKLGELKKQKAFVPVTAQDLDATKSARAALQQIEAYERLIDKLGYPEATGNVAQDIVNVQKNRAALYLRTKAGDPEAKKLIGLQGTIANLARATGDAGNVGERERDFLKETTLTTEETKQSAKAKLAQIKEILLGVLKSRGMRAPGGSTGTGYRTSKEAPTGEGWGN